MLVLFYIWATRGSQNPAIQQYSPVWLLVILLGLTTFTLSGDLNMAERALRSGAGLQHGADSLSELDQLVRFLGEGAGQDLCVYLEYRHSNKRVFMNNNWKEMLRVFLYHHITLMANYKTLLYSYFQISCVKLRILFWLSWHRMKSFQTYIQIRLKQPEVTCSSWATVLLLNVTEEWWQKVTALHHRCWTLFWQIVEHWLLPAALSSNQ